MVQLLAVVVVQVLLELHRLVVMVLLHLLQELL
jgi:hypothetical protein